MICIRQILIVAIILVKISTNLLLAKEESSVYHAFLLQGDAGTTFEGDFITNWALDGWVGDDTHKFILKSEGSYAKDELEEAEFWGMYGLKISDFWDLHIGGRYDNKPKDIGYGVVGFEGLSPYFFEIESYLSISDEGDVSFRFGIEKEFLLTQKFILIPYFETNIFFQDIADIDIGAGFSDLKTGVQLKYEITRSFAIYTDISYETKLGNTANIAVVLSEEKSEAYAVLGFSVLL